jgi:signal transduction histidine kinase
MSNGKMDPASRGSSLPYGMEVRRFVVGGLLFVLFLAGVSLLGLWSTTEWAVSSSLRRCEAEARSVGEVLRRSEASTEKIFSDAAVLDRLRGLGALQAAIYDPRGSLVSQADFLAWSPVLPERLGPDSLPAGLAPVARLKSLQGVGAIAVTLALPERRAFLWVAFDGTGAAAARRTVNVLAAVVPAGALLLLVLVAPFLRRLLRPMEALNETALAAGALVTPAAFHAGEPGAAVEIFRRTIGELRLRTAELESLRQAEKERADALAVTADTLVRSHPGGVLVVDAGGRVRDANGPALALLGLDRTAIGGEASEVLASSGAVREAVARAAGGAPTLASEFVREEPEPGAEQDSARYLSVTAVPVAEASGSGRSLGTLVFVEDRTSETRLRSELSRERQLAALGEMSAGIAHEFRNSTATILGWARLAAATDDRGERASQLARLREEAEHVARVTGDFLFFARPDRLVLERTDLDVLVAEVVAEERLASGGTVFTVEGSLGEASVDAGLLRRALVNVVRNAREAAGTEGGGTVRIRCERAPEATGNVRILVEDSGPGIPEEAVAGLFVPFASTKAGGTGLGLSLVARIVALHRGSVSVDRSRELGGAAFFLSLPRETPPGAAG